MNARDLALMKRYSIVHALFSVAIATTLYFVCEDWFVALLLYAAVLLFLPKLAELISRIGFYKTDRIYYSDGTVDYGEFTRFYGPISVFRDLAFYVVGCSIPITVANLLLPETVFLPLFMAALFLLLFRFVLYPLIEDISWLFAKKDPTTKLATFYAVSFIAIIVLGIAATVAFASISYKSCPKKLDVNTLLAAYFEDKDLENPYAAIDMNDAEIEFSQLSTRAELNFDQQIASGSGLAYPGSQMKFTYSVFSGSWSISSHDFTGEAEIVSTVVYAGEAQLKNVANYSGLAKVEVTIFSKTPEGGQGVLKITDKATSAEVYTTKFTFDGHEDYYGNVKFAFEKPLFLGAWDVYEEEFKWESIDHLYFFMNLTDINMYRQK